MEKIIHQGRNIKRFREMLGIKQDALALDLGLSQQAVSALEQKEALDEQLRQQIAALLKVPAEAIKNFDEEKAINIISNNSFENCDQPASVWMEALDENKRLYEARLKDKDETIGILQRLVEKK